MTEYHSYLVRCWDTAEAGADGVAVERFTVESVSHAKRRWRFTTFEDLVRFLQAEFLAPCSDQVPTTGEQPGDQGAVRAPSHPVQPS